MRTLINRSFRLVLIALSAYLALKALVLLLDGQRGSWIWCIHGSPRAADAFLTNSTIDIISLVALGPIVEELIFRYFGFKVIRYFTPKISAIYIILLTTIAFTLSHNQYGLDGVNWSALAGIFMTGLVLGGTFATRGRLVDSIVVHSTLNLTILLSTETTLLGLHCARLNGWLGGVALLVVLASATIATLVLISGLRDRAAREVQLAPKQFGAKSNVTD